MTKEQEKQLASYKKANATRKKILLARMGYKTEVKYFEALAISKKPSAKKATPVKVKTFKASKITETKDDSVPTDYIIAFDTTGSMASYIGAVKIHVEQLVDKLFTNTKDLRVGIVAFGDYCDMKSSTDFGKAYQVLDLTDNKEKIINFIRGAKSTDGGDGDEFYELVIKKINEESSWRKNTKHAVLLIGDAPCHKVGYHHGNIQNNQIDWREEAHKAKNLGIQYDTLMITDINWYEELSKITGGIALPFKSAATLDNIIEGTIYARASTSSFTTSYSSAMASGDKELIGAYKKMATSVADFDPNA